jgi:hypothetical protein
MRIIFPKGHDVWQRIEMDQQKDISHRTQRDSLKGFRDIPVGMICVCAALPGSYYMTRRLADRVYKPQTNRIIPAIRIGICKIFFYLSISMNTP